MLLVRHAGVLYFGLNAWEARRMHHLDMSASASPDMSGLKTPLEDVLGLQIDGKRAILARYPNANPEIDLFPKGWISAKTKWAAPRTYPDPKWVLDETPVRNVSTMFLVRLGTCSHRRAAWFNSRVAAVGVEVCARRTTWLALEALARWVPLCTAPGTCVLVLTLRVRCPAPLVPLPRPMLPHPTSRLQVFDPPVR